MLFFVTLYINNINNNNNYNNFDKCCLDKIRAKDGKRYGVRRTEPPGERKH